MNDWKAQASHDGWGNGVLLHVGRRQDHLQQLEVVTEINGTGTKIETKNFPESVAVFPEGLLVHPDVAEAIYHALHRLYGQEHQEGKVEALQEALAVERSRVHAFLQSTLNRLAQPPAHTITAPPEGAPSGD